MLATLQHFGFSHITVLTIITVITVFMILLCRKKAHSSSCRIALAVLAFLCFAIYPTHQTFHTLTGGADKLDALLPFHLCDIAAIICGFALLTRKPILCELAYFWGLAGTMQGLLTPDINHDFPNPLFIIFFLHHGVIVLTALLLPLGLGWRPRPRAALRAFTWVLIYAAGAFILNYLLSTNFGFLIHKPETASLLDIMGPWPWYVLVLVIIAGLMFYLLEFPFRKSQSDSTELNETN